MVVEPFVPASKVDGLLVLFNPNVPLNGKAGFEAVVIFTGRGSTELLVEFELIIIPLVVHRLVLLAPVTRRSSSVESVVSSRCGKIQHGLIRIKTSKRRFLSELKIVLFIEATACQTRW